MQKASAQLHLELRFTTPEGPEPSRATGAHAHAEPLRLGALEPDEVPSPPPPASHLGTMEGGRDSAWDTWWSSRDSVSGTSTSILNTASHTFYRAKRLLPTPLGLPPPIHPHRARSKEFKAERLSAFAEMLAEYDVLLLQQVWLVRAASARLWS